MVVPDPPPHQKIASTGPTVHTSKRAAHKIEQSFRFTQSMGRLGLKAEEPITVGPKRLPDSPFPKRVSPILYHRPGTPYRKVDPPGTEIVPETLGAGILDKAEDSFEVDSESERTLTEEPKTPKFEKNISGTPEGITKRKLVSSGLAICKRPKTKDRIKSNSGT